VYRPAEICQFDLWEPRAEIPVGWGQTRRGWVVVACLGYSRAGAAALVFSKQTEDLVWGIARCLGRLGVRAERLVWDRQAGVHAGDGRPTAAYAALCGQLRCDWQFCQPADPQAKGCVERLQGYLETSFEPGRRFANELDYQQQLDAWFDERANQRMHATLRCRPCDRLAEERLLRPLAAGELPDLDRRVVLRVGVDPYLRVDTCDYSLDPALVGSRGGGPHRPARDHRRRRGRRRAGLSARTQLRPAPHHHRARARPPTPRRDDRGGGGAAAA
jgi:hypothetical protein